MRFLSAIVAVFAGVFALVMMIDYVEMMRRTGDIQDVSAFFIAKISLFRVPLIAERMLPFAVLVGAMSCYLSLSRRLELVVARAAGMSAWQFIAPALVIAAPARRRHRPRSTIRSSADLREQSKRLEAEMSGRDSGLPASRRRISGCASAATTASPSSTPRQPRAGRRAWQRHRLPVRSQRRTSSIASRPRRATLEPGYWRLEEARVYASGVAAGPSATSIGSPPT